MRSMTAWSTLIVLLLMSTASIAQKVKPGIEMKQGILVVRGGDATQSKNYKPEEINVNGELSGVSVLCNAGIAYSSDKKILSAKIKQLIGKLKGFDNFSYANTTCLINKEGIVKTDPQSGNNNHCLIYSIKLKDATSCFVHPE
ncbi:MAG: hypothetical protein WCA21_03775 [Terracidiphilus sp.]